MKNRPGGAKDELAKAPGPAPDHHSCHHDATPPLNGGSWPTNGIEPLSMLRDPMSNSAATTAAVSAPTFQLAFSLACPRPAAGSLPLARSAWPQLSLAGYLVPPLGPWGPEPWGREPWGPEPWGPEHLGTGLLSTGETGATDTCGTHQRRRSLPVGGLWPLHPFVCPARSGGGPGQLVTAFEAWPDQCAEAGTTVALGLPNSQVANPPALLCPTSSGPKRLGMAEGASQGPQGGQKAPSRSGVKERPE